MRTYVRYLAAIVRQMGRLVRRCKQILKHPPGNTRLTIPCLMVYHCGVIHGLIAMKRNGQGKFALKNDGYRCVRSLRLTDSTWEALGATAQSLGITRADYLEQMVRSNEPPSITRKEEEVDPSITPQKTEGLPSITRYEEEIEQRSKWQYGIFVKKIPC